MPSERAITVGGHPIRVWEAGDNPNVPPAVFFAGLGGLPRWPHFLDELATTRRVIVPSLPGFPGAPNFRHLDTLLDWIIHAIATIEALDVEPLAGEREGRALRKQQPVDLIGSSVGGALAADLSAIAGGLVHRLVLIAPFGCFDADEPAADIWAQPPGPDSIPNLVCENPENWQQAWEVPEGVEAIDWQVMQTRAMEAAARLLFPFGDTGVLNRLHRVHHPTLLLRGEKDRVLPASYNQRFAQALAGPARSATIADAGHLPELDAPQALAREINAFLADQAL